MRIFVAAVALLQAGYTLGLNDRCSRATHLICGSTVAGNSTLSSRDSTSDCGVSHSAPQLWYYVDVASGQLGANMCNAATKWDTQLSIYTGSSCSDLKCVDGVNDGCGGEYKQSKLSTSVTKGRYYIMVHGYAKSSGAFNLAVNCIDKASPSRSRSPAKASRSRSPRSASRIPSRSRSRRPSPSQSSSSSPSAAPSDSPVPSDSQSPVVSDSQSPLSSDSTSDSTSPLPSDSPSPVSSDSPSPVQPSPIEDTGCHDTIPDWRDSEEDSCQSYERQEWCTADGGFGVQWDATWGVFSDYANQGGSAVDFCCVCGGGLHDPSPSPAPVLPSPAETGCRDTIDNWVDSEGDVCATYLQQQWCNADGSYGAHWDDTWGPFTDYSNQGGSATDFCCVCGGGIADSSPSPAESKSGDEDGSCQDTVTNWEDSEGDSCHTYHRERWCNADGTVGTGWDSTWGVLSDYSAKGGDAAQYCCACGGGVHLVSPSPEVVRDGECSDSIANWVDSEGDNCSTYHEQKWCTRSGKYGSGWSDAWGVFTDYTNQGGSALDYCCECGGGNVTNDSEPCQDVHCGEHQHCNPVNKGCVCDDGYVSANGLCTPVNGDCGGACADRDHEHCDANTQQCVCDEGHHRDDSGECEENDPCHDVTCGDHQHCNPSTAGCECDAGFVSSNGVCAATGPCQDVHCGEHQHCNPANKGCECDAGFVSANGVCASVNGDCEGRCADREDEHCDANTQQCVCDEGHHRGQSGECEDDDPCHDVTCGEHQHCNPSTAGCECDAGFVSSNGICVATGPCQNVHCGEHQHCNPVHNGCECDAGYVSANGVCAPVNGDCGGRCADREDEHCDANTQQCVCDEGHHRSQSGDCEDDDPCHDVSCGEHQHCNPSTAGCECDAGFVSTNGICAGTGPCQNVHCGEHQHCNPVNNGCECDAGYVSANGVCAPVNGNCGGRCADREDEHCDANTQQCVCDEGHHRSQSGDCEDDDPCHDVTCGEHQHCNPSTAGCECDAGFVSRNGICAVSGCGQCKEHEHCNEATHHCECESGYKRDAKGHCDVSDGCPSGSIFLDGSCQGCVSPCAECSGARTFCTACVPGKFLWLDICVDASGCPAGTVAVDGVCKKCEAPCTRCHEAPDECTECVVGKFLHEDECLDPSDCPSGTVAVDGICRPCVSPCATCSGAVQICTACIPGKFMLHGICVDANGCPAGTVPEDGLCKACTSPCATCSGRSTTCTACVADKYLLNGDCVPANRCPDGTVALDRLCRPCISPCSKCVGAVHFCTGCVSGKFLLNEICVDAAGCPGGTQPVDGICKLTRDTAVTSQTSVSEISSTQPAWVWVVVAIATVAMAALAVVSWMLHQSRGLAKHQVDVDEINLEEGSLTSPICVPHVPHPTPIAPDRYCRI